MFLTARFTETSNVERPTSNVERRSEEEHANCRECGAEFGGNGAALAVGWRRGCFAWRYAHLEAAEVFDHAEPHRGSVILLRFALNGAEQSESGEGKRRERDLFGKVFEPADLQSTIRSDTAGESRASDDL